MSLRALAERRELQGDDVEAVVEVLAEVALRDALLEVAVRGGDDAHVDLERLVAADALERPLLQEAQQLHLRGQGDLAHLVEEERAAVGLLEAALAPGDRAGERALLVAEELALQERLAERRAVEPHERRLGARAGAVDRLGDQLLAGAALAVDEHAGAARRHLLDERAAARTMPGCEPMTWPKALRSRSRSRRRAFSWRSRERSIARSTTTASTAKSSGLVR